MAKETDENFTPLFDALAQAYGLVTAAVYGRVWRYCQHDSGSCFASLDRIACDLGIDRATVQRHIVKLMSNGYISDMTPGRKNHPHTYRLTQKPFEMAGAGVAESNSGVAVRNTGVAESRMKIQEDTNQETKPNANAPAVVGTTQPPTVLATGIVNSTSLDKPIVDGVADYAERSFKAQARATETLIRKWNLPAHLEDLCITFAGVFGIEADGPTPTITKGSRGAWAGGAKELHELKPTHAELIKARDYAIANGYSISSPRAAVKTIINLRQLSNQAKPAPLTHSQPTRAFEWRQNEAGEMYRHYTDSEVQA